MTKPDKELEEVLSLFDNKVKQVNSGNMDTNYEFGLKYSDGNAVHVLTNWVNIRKWIIKNFSKYAQKKVEAGRKEIVEIIDEQIAKEIKYMDESRKFGMNTPGFNQDMGAKDVLVLLKEELTQDKE